ncbi:MAG: glycine cleavage system protein GcvH [Caldilineae bacterium]|nr:MAG: glycine cleavage system protein GcvH [Caldilineae bacterium]
MSYKFDSDARYTENDEWARLEDDLVVCGITDYAQDQLSDVVYVELPEVGATVSAGDAVAVVESVKAAADVYAPVSGEIVAVNEALEDSPELVNEDPFGAAWFFKIAPSNLSELDELMDQAAYETYIEEREEG